MAKKASRTGRGKDGKFAKGNSISKGLKNNGRKSLYDPEYCEMLIDHMSKGMSYESFAAELSVCRQTLYYWEKQYPDFSNAKSQGKEKMLNFFERMGIQAMAGKIKGFNAPTYIFTMKNKCGWTDKVEQEVDNSININLDFNDSDL